jgi:hypothetical protein
MSEPHDPERLAGDLPLAHASRLLRMGLSGPRRPVDDLIDRLRRPDGSPWLTSALAAALAPGESPRELLIDGGGSLERLRAIKERGKAMLQSFTTPQERLSGLACYFMSIAAALRHHRTPIGGRDDDELRSALLDLAESAPPPWDDLVAQATL